MLNIKEHFKKRYCERILGMSDEKEVLYYLAQNQERVVEQCGKLFKYSKFLWRGAIGDNITRNYHICGAVIIVTTTDESTLITLYKVDYGFPEKTNRKVANDLLDEIRQLDKKYDDVVEQANAKTDQLKLEQENTARQMAYLEDQMRLLKQRNDILNETIKQLNNEPFLIQRDIDKYASQLCNSLALKMDLLILNKKQSA